MAGPVVPPGYSPPFQVVDDLHHGAWIIIVAALGLVLSLVSFSIRLYVRLALHPPFGKDDYVLLGATIVAIIQVSLIFEAAAKGLGTSMTLIDIKDLRIIQVLIITSDILYLLTLYTTKCCVVGIYLRLTPQKLHNRASWAALLLCTLWIIPAILILTVDCGLKSPLKGSSGQCENLVPRWKFVVALDIVTELVLFGLAVLLLAGLFMPLKQKFTIGFAFVFRLPIITFAVMHIYHLNKDIGSHDPTRDAIPSLIWGQVELHYALVACGVFCLRPFMAAVSTNYGTAGDSTLESTRYAYGQTQKSSGYRSKSASAMGSGGGTQVVIGNEAVAFGAAREEMDRMSMDGGHGGAGSHGPDDDVIELVDWDHARPGSDGTHGSARMMIRKDVQISVEYDGGAPDRVLHHESEYWDRYLEAQRPRTGMER
ncbi:uncharacterized protein DSM5745_04576 [Aspergillus mulundensis]|uniref:Rhodopsin domain-containing protein n=1 Tax=Aspergillus mulundensis TaxID=1810919 RepID=A0A3D8S402_9EURO|nr:Uncharacterized protein DSM5745_04576 [Aspergillus mulundensis]RDW81019.1 Uncharacterized protein DSM5745_04576 [Aspergillus mulundensis]